MRRVWREVKVKRTVNIGPFRSKREAVCWAAGIFEGEGCFEIGSSGRKTRTRLELGMTDQDTVQRFNAIMGCGTLVARDRDPGRYKTVYRWRAARAEHIKAICDAFQPYMGVRRTAKLQLIRQIAKETIRRKYALARVDLSSPIAHHWSQHGGH